MPGPWSTDLTLPPPDNDAAMALHTLGESAAATRRRAGGSAIEEVLARLADLTDLAHQASILLTDDTATRLRTWLATASPPR